MAAGAKTQYDCNAAFSETDFTDDLKSLTMPVLFVHAEHNQIVPFEDSAHKATKLVRDGTLKTYSGLSHGLSATHPDVANAGLLDSNRA